MLLYFPEDHYLHRVQVLLLQFQDVFVAIPQNFNSLKGLVFLPAENLKQLSHLFEVGLQQQLLNGRVGLLDVLDRLDVLQKLHLLGSESNLLLEENHFVLRQTLGFAKAQANYLGLLQATLRDHVEALQLLDSLVEHVEVFVDFQVDVGVDAQQDPLEGFQLVLLDFPVERENFGVDLEAFLQVVRPDLLLDQTEEFVFFEGGVAVFFLPILINSP